MTLRPELVLPFMVLACAQNPKPSGEGSVLSGTVAYRERIALPQDAVVQVQLSDVSVQDAAAPVIAETTVKPEGRQVPLPFELRYDPSKLDPKRTYAVRATVRSGGQLRFTTTTVTPVLTQGNPSRADLMLTRAGSQAQGAPGALWGTSWRLEDLAAAGVVDQSQATLEFPQEGKVIGNASCNRFFGSVQVSGDSIAFSRMGATRMACLSEATMTQEAAYLKALESAERYTIDGSSLLIYSKGTARPLRFTRTSP
jgi:putative lipoprotein